MRLIPRTLCFLALSGALAGLQQLGAEDGAPASKDGTNTVSTVELRFRAAREPKPALKYRLLPTFTERKPGNAASHYYRAILLQRQLPKEYWQEQSDHEVLWNEGAKADYPKQQVGTWLEKQRNVFNEIRQAAYREHCDWDFRLQDLHGSEVYAFLLPEIQECRQLARAIRIKARYEIIEGRLDDALESLRWGYQLARNTAEPPLLVSALVGVAIAGVMNVELEHLMSESPVNFYWAIAALPRPLVDLRPALEFEMNAPFQVLPFLRDAETVDRSPEEWRRLIVQSLRELQELSGQRQLEDWQGELAAAALMTKLYPLAKERLIADGMDQGKVEAMSAPQVVAVHTARVTASAYHDIYKLSLLPYDQAAERLPAMMKRLEKDTLRPDAALRGAGGLPIASLLLPAVEGVLRADVRAARSIAALQTIEAIRMHAGENGGKLPQSLTEISLVPVPHNPATGQPFPYQFNAAEGTATLEMPTLAPLQPRHDGKRYKLHVDQ